MTSDKRDKCKEAVKILGPEKVRKLYELFGSEKIPIASLNRLILKETFLESFNGKKSISKIAGELKISRMTLYRILKGKLKKVKK
jgi:DNA invertase Pin-like site-specific DNA recombinase